MKILVIGSTGRVGNLLTKKLLEENHIVVGTSRQQQRLFESKNYSQINLNLLNNMEEIKKIIPNDIEAIYFVSGSRGKNLLEVDLHGAIKTIQAAEALSIGRYIMLSTIFALETNKWDENELKDFRGYYIAKHYADQWLINTDLNYSILQPGTLKEIKGSGKIEVNVNKVGDNSIEDVASTLVEVLNTETSYKKVITMHTGKTSIKKAISEV